MLEIILLALGILLSGAYAVSLKPANSRCRSLSDFQLFNTFFSMSAMLGALVFMIIKGGFSIPAGGIINAAVFGVLFSLCVFGNLTALQYGPVSLTTLLINFSLLMPLIYSFCFLGEKITVFRVVGIVLLFVCMFLFTNPKITGEKKFSLKWLLLTVATLFVNGTLTLISKIYAIETENLYAPTYLFLCYFFATAASFIIFFILNSRTPKEKRNPPKKFFTPIMCFLMLFIGMSNFGMNLIVLLLATRMDGAIVYPAIQGGGLVITTVLSILLFGEKISFKKAFSIAIGVAAIILLNI